MFEWHHDQRSHRATRVLAALFATLLAFAFAAVISASPAFALNNCGTQIKAKTSANASGQIYLPSGQPSCDSAAVTAVFVVNGFPTTKTSNYSGMASNAIKSVTYTGATDSTSVRGCSVNAPISCTWSSSYSGTSWWTHN